MFRHATAWTAAIAAAFVALLVALEAHGRRGRVVLAPPATRTVSYPADAHRAWRLAGVRGRVLLLFDRYPHFHTSYPEFAEGAPLRDENFLEYGIFEGVLRKLFLVVPDGEWEEFVRRADMYRPILRERNDRAMYLHTGSGVPLLAAPESALPPLSEPALVYVNAARFDPARVAALLARRGIRADLTVVHAPGAR